MKLFELIQNDKEHQKYLDNTGFWGKRGAGCIFFAMDTNRFLIAHRSRHVQEPSTWGTWGGAIDSSETPESAVSREVREESGYTGNFKLIHVYDFKHESGFVYHNYIAVVESEFTPELDWESQGYEWAEYGNWPSPLHPGLQNLINQPEFKSVCTRLLKSNKRINESVLTEALADVEQDVDYIYRKYFTPLVAKIKNGRIDQIPSPVIISSEELVSADCKKANEVNPISIVIYSQDGNYYKPEYKYIAIGFNPDVLTLIDIHGSLIDAMKQLVDNSQRQAFMLEFSESRIRGSISHELSHWVDDSLHNSHIEKKVNNPDPSAIRNGRASKLLSDHEIHAQMHNIRELKNQMGPKWNRLSFDDMVKNSPSLSVIKTEGTANGWYDQWKHRVLKRMGREGLIGARMR